MKTAVFFDGSPVDFCNYPEKCVVSNQQFKIVLNSRENGNITRVSLGDASNWIVFTLDSK